MNTQTQFPLRNTPQASDKSSIIEILSSSGFFYNYEIDVAGELIDENLSKGEEKSGYYFIFADSEDKTIGFTCFGPIACTESSYDLFWIGVHKDYMHQGIGQKLLQATEETIKKSGGTRIYIETSGQEIYKPTREFYLKAGYTIEAELEDFYGKNDSKFIYLKKL